MHNWKVLRQNKLRWILKRKTLPSNWKTHPIDAKDSNINWIGFNGLLWSPKCTFLRSNCEKEIFLWHKHRKSSATNLNQIHHKVIYMVNFIPKKNFINLIFCVFRITKTTRFLCQLYSRCLVLTQLLTKKWIVLLIWKKNLRMYSMDYFIYSQNIIACLVCFHLLRHCGGQTKLGLTLYSLREFLILLFSLLVCS